MNSSIRFQLFVLASTLLAASGPGAFTSAQLTIAARVGVAAAVDPSVGTCIRVSKETTYVTAPLTPGGRVDYVEAFNQLAGKGVNVENNAAVLLTRALGPEVVPKSGSLREQFFAKLGIPIPSKKGRHFLSLAKYAEHVAGPNSDAYADALFKEEKRAAGKLWSRADLPKLAAWLDFNQEPLEVILEATKRPAYYRPVIVPLDLDSGLRFGAALFPLSWETRSIADALTARAMLGVQEGRIADAQTDLLACHRLARLIAKGQTGIDGLVGVAIETRACGAGRKVLQSGRLSEIQLLQYKQALAQLPPLWSAAEQINVVARFAALECTVYIADSITEKGFDGWKAFYDMAGMAAKTRGATLPPPPSSENALGNIDWNSVLKTINSEYDQIDSAISTTRYSDRRTAMKSYEKHMKQMQTAWKELPELSAIAKVDQKRASRIIADVLMSLLASSIQPARTAQDQAVTKLQLLRVGVALERFRKRNGCFPDGLNELKLADGRGLLIDLYTDKPFLYHRIDSGYLLYSSGANQDDDGGQTFDSNPPGDDIVLQIELKR